MRYVKGTSLSDRIWRDKGTTSATTLYVDVSEAKYNQFMLTIEKVDSGLVLQLRRVARDSNRELRFTLNSSAFGPGNYLVRVDGYNWRGQTENVGWMMLGME